MKRFLLCLLSVVLVWSLTACGGSAQKNDTIVIYSSSEDFRNEHIASRLKSQFPDYNIVLQYLSTGNNAARLMAEGTGTECDIVLGLEVGYMEQLGDILADVSDYDTSVFLPDLVPASGRYLPWERFSGSIVVSRDALKQHGLTMPASYDDLLDSQYKGLISMANPATSGTGYFFLLNQINTLGEDAAFDYFDKLTPNVLQYTSSGSGVVNALTQGETAIGLGMTFQAVSEINKGANLEILFFEEGAPYTTGGFGIINGKQDRPEVQEVFAFLLSDLIYEDKELFTPEQIFIEQEITTPNYPQDIPYADMSRIDDIEYKKQVLEKWKY